MITHLFEASDEAKKRIAIGLGILIALAAAFSAGRFSAPLKVETHDVIKTVYQDKIVTQIQTVEVVKTVEAKAKTETKIVYLDRVITKDGTITEHVVEKTADAESSTKTEDASKKVQSTTDEQVSASSLEEHTKTVTLRPSWSVSLQIGAAIPKPWLPLYGPLVIGAEVNYRIVGGLSGGVWINTVGAAGGALTLEF